MKGQQKKKKLQLCINAKKNIIHCIGLQYYIMNEANKNYEITYLRGRYQSGPFTRLTYTSIYNVLTMGVTNNRVTL